MKAVTEEVIDPRLRIFSVPWGELLRYRDLVGILIARDFEVKYRLLRLWPLWLVLQPFMFSAVLALVFGRFMGIHTEGVGKIPFYLGGFIIWNFFAHCLMGVSRTFGSARPLFSKIYFPRLLVPISSVLFDLAELVVPLILFLIICARSPASPDPAGWPVPLRIAAVPVLIAEAAALGLGAGLWIAAVSVKVRDAQFATGFGLQLWMFLSPVVYPASIIPERWGMVLRLNPMTEVLEGLRAAVFGTGRFEPVWQLAAAGITAAVLWSGLAAFQWAENVFMEED